MAHVVARPARSLAAALMLAAIASLAAASPAPAVKKSFFGVQDWQPPSPEEFVELGRMGVGRVRLTFGWSQHEYTQGDRRWGYGDDMAYRAAVSGVDLLPVLDGMPPFAAADPHDPPMTPEARAGFADYIRDAVARYGRGGSFWKENRHLPYRPIKSWQVWNEPNFPAYWLDKPNAKQYVSLLALAARAIRSSDPKAEVVMAGIPETRAPLGIPATRFLKQLYRVRGARRHFDVLAINPYAGGPSGVMGAVIRTRRTMKRNGDGRKPLLITEFGWSTGGRVSSRTERFKTSLRGQARKLKRTYRALMKNRRRYRIRGASWFSVRDRPRRSDESDWWGIHSGLKFADGREKPAWSAFAQITTRNQERNRQG